MRTQRQNRLHLADMLENRITDEQFDMGCYANECGTVGCALGIAVLSGEFGYGAVPPETARKQLNNFYIKSWMPVKDGRVTWWNVAGRDIFGEDTQEKVFSASWRRSRQAVAAELRAIK